MQGLVYGDGKMLPPPFPDPGLHPRTWTGPRPLARSAGIESATYN